MWRAVFREYGASGSVDAGSARLGLLIALFPASLGCHDDSLFSRGRFCTLCACAYCRTEAWSFRGIMEALSKWFRAQVLRMHSTHPPS